MSDTYHCDKCNVTCISKASWERHINTAKHKTGKRAVRSDKKRESNKCPHCDYESNNNLTMKNHIMSRHKTRQEREKECPFYCKYCDFGTFHQKIYDIHLNSTKHKKAEEFMKDK